jgi:hypothetical protein
MKVVSLLVFVLPVLVTACDSPTRPDGSNPIWRGGEPVLLRPWSEVTGRIAVHYFAGPEERRTVLIDANQRAIVHLGDFGTFVDRIALSSDGARLALGYAVGWPYDYPARIHVSTTASGTVGNYTSSIADDYSGFHPVWTHDQRVSYWRGDTLYAHQAALMFLPGAKLSAHSWAPDDSYFVLTWTEAGADSYSVYRVTTANGAMQEIIPRDASTSWFDPTIAPSGALMAVKRTTSAYLNYRAGEIWIGNSDGSALRRVHALPVTAFAWSPNSEQLVFTGGEGNCTDCPPMEQPGVYLLDLADSTIRKLMDVNAFLVSWSQ